MKQIACLFEYFKLAFAINKDNKALYKPQIILIALKTCLVIFSSFVVYDYISLIDDIDMITQDMIFAKLMSTGFIFLAIFFVSLLVKIAFEAGLYNMYKDCVKNSELATDSFSQGVKKYFAKFLLADILLLILWILMLIPYIIIGFVTMFAGFIIIPIIVSIFTAMWKVSMVMDDLAIVESFKRGFSFAKMNFWPLSFLIIIKNSFANIASGSGGSSGNNMSNMGNNTSSVGDGFGSGFDTSSFSETLPITNNVVDPSMDLVLGYIKIAFFILVPVISIAVVISSLIKMIFDVFFSLSIFLMYAENSDSEKIDLVKEVL